MLYLVESNGYLKVGYTQNLNSRKSNYSSENPEFEFIATREGDRKDESYLHELLLTRVHHGEWMLYDEFIVELNNLKKKYKYKLNLKNQQIVFQNQKRNKQNLLYNYKALSSQTNNLVIEGLFF